MKIYIACHDSALAEEYAKKLSRRAHTIGSTWHQKPLEKSVELDDDQKRWIAVHDLLEIEQSDAVLLIGGDEKYAGGKFVEAGYALALGKPVFVEGRRENVLMWDPRIKDANQLWETA